MAVKSSVFQVTRLGVETTPGTGVAANRRMPNIMSHGNAKWDTKAYRGQGYKYPTIVVPNKDWSVLAYDGPQSYGELTYVYASIFSSQTATTVSGASTWTFTHNVSAADVPQTYTLEHGDGTTCGKLVNGLFTDMTLAYSRDECKVSGNGIGKLWTPAVTPTASPTLVENVPVVANQVDVFLDSTFGAIGTTKLTRSYTLELGLTGRWGPDWVFDSANTSWKNHVELVPTVSLKMDLANDADSDAFITQMRANATKYLQIKSTGALVGGIGAVHYSNTVNIAFQVVDGSEPKDLAGVYAANWQLQPVADPTAGYAIQAVLVNGTASL